MNSEVSSRKAVRHGVVELPSVTSASPRPKYEARICA